MPKLRLKQMGATKNNLFPRLIVLWKIAGFSQSYSTQIMKSKNPFNIIIYFILYIILLYILI